MRKIFYQIGENKKLGSTKMNKKHKKYKGFSLPEVIISMFIFVLIMLVVVSVFVVMVNARKNAQDMQKKMENIRYAMDFMAKNIRMSSIDDSCSSINQIYIYNYSQGKCMHFKLISSSSGNKIQVEETPSVAREDLVNAGSNCSSNPIVYSTPTGSATLAYSVPVDLATEGVDSIKFSCFLLGSNYTLGRVTISMQMSGGFYPVQTTVALRNSYSSVTP